MAQGYKINFDKEIEIVVLLPNYQKILSFFVKNSYRLVACKKKKYKEMSQASHWNWHHFNREHT